MDAAGVDRPTALVCGERAVLLREAALTLAERGYDVHLPQELTTGLDPSGRWRRRLHPAEDAERALLAAVVGRARPLEVAVLDRAEPSVARAVTVLQGLNGRGRVLELRRPRWWHRAPRALDVLYVATQRRRVVRALHAVAPRA